MDYNIYKVKNGNSSISLCPKRWWLITSIIIKWREILYLDKETLFDVSKSIRWGIPVLFPNAGIIPDSQIDYWYNLKQHWFARNMHWKYKILAQDKFIMTLSQDLGTRDMFDYNFGFEIVGEILKNWEVKITQNIINTWLKELPVSCWLHPYFLVQQDKKHEIGFDFKGANIVREDYNNRSNWLKTVISNPNKLKVNLPWNGKIKIEYSKEFEQVWFRSEDGKDFICIEPIMRKEPSILDNPYLIKIWETLSMSMKFGM